MPHARFAGDEIERRGEAIYAEKLQETVETEDNIGKIISIDIETGEYEIGDDPVSPAVKLQAKHPDAAIYGKRIGFSAVFELSAALA